MSKTIRSARLAVEIADPGEAPNNTCRFDRTGFITQVTLDNTHVFCSKEPDNLVHPSSGGVGLCNEFRCAALADQVKPGMYYAKFGIGLFQKPDDHPYIFYARYECDPYQVDMVESDARISYTIHEKACHGYALRHKKEVYVEENRLIVDTVVENVGDKKVVFDEYNHNFTTIDRLPMGADYQLHLPSVMPLDKLKTEEPASTMVGRDNLVTFTGYCETASGMIIPRRLIHQDRPFSWKLTHRESPASISETVSFAPNQIVVWAVGHIVSPQVFLHEEILPGECAHWVRQWCFEA